MKIKQIVSVLLGSLLMLLSISGLTAFAETSLPDGAVKGLPERLAALDDEGNHVNSESGEYFFHVENMRFGEVYSKNIQLINLREDNSYRLWFYVSPKFKSGEIDLEACCECRFLLDGKEIYKGDVNGDGSIDISSEYFYLGNYKPGDSHILRAEIVWNKMQDITKSVDNGHKLVDKDGEHVLVEPSGTADAYGEIEFKWTFFAMLTPHDSTPDEGDQHRDGYAPQTGLFLRNGTFWLVCIGVIAVMIVVLLILIKRSKKKEKDK